ncbi:MAG TPA: phosphopantetheine-binding protein [Polyangiales bacterium]
MVASEIIRSVVASNAEPPRAPEELRESDALADLGIDSLKFMLVVIDLELQLGRQVFKVDDVPCIQTVHDIMRLV